MVYSDLVTDTHFQPSVNGSSAANKHFAWRFASAFGSTVPALRVRLYNAVTGGLLSDENTTDNASCFERTANDGGTWGAWTTADKSNETTYLRYTPTSLGDGIKVRAVLTLQ